MAASLIRDNIKRETEVVKLSFDSAEEIER